MPPHPQAGRGRLVSLLLAVGMAGLIFAYPRVVAASAADVRHGLLTLLMWGIAAGFVHGVGFAPRLPLWRIVFHPWLAWALMVGGGYLLLKG